jgi:hypothetical protein
MLALGDIIERCLRFFGITKERVSAVAGKDCGCQQRQAAMNQAGYFWQQALFRRYYGARDSFLSAYYRLQSSRLRLSARFAWMAVRVLFYGR